jgi:cytochrome c oxidase subunit IV
MNPAPVKHLISAWLALLGLLGLTLGSAYVPMGAGNFVVNLTIAVLKALIVAWVFMHATRSGPFVRLLAATGVLWLLILVGLGMTDYASRDASDRPQPTVEEAR